MPCDSLEQLVDDILIEILCGLPVRDILSVRQASKRLSFVTRTRNVWHHKFCSEVLGRGPSLSEDGSRFLSVSSSDLEWRTRRAMRLHKKWTAIDSVKACTFEVPAEHGPARQVMLVPEAWRILTVHENRVLCWQLLDSLDSGLSVQPSGEYAFPSDDAPRLVRDSAGSDIIALGSRTRHQMPVIIFSVAKHPSFVERHVIPSLPGLLVGMWHHLLFCDTTMPDVVEDARGIEIRDWRHHGGGTVLCPKFHPSCGDLLDLQIFSCHLLVVWDAAIAVYPMPEIPEEGQTIAEPVKIYLFAERVSRPIAFTTCRANLDTASAAAANSSTAAQALTIIARPKFRPYGLVHSVMRPLIGDTSDFPFSLTRIPNRTERICSALSCGSSGRGIWIDCKSVLRCSPAPMMLPSSDIQYTVDFVPNPVWTLNTRLNPETACMDFDEGMGLIVVGTEGGKVSIIDLA
ncbi:hypothetical protein NEOLEDRAFT_1132928 [Neolentinus lepideus HHB14362 ss-1]|uniref:F-box domain-containing protein n=1 Tax=Neolentinus lepideus HHB14362 ss-1 TaxID=1314782 RepID=A0A165SZ96_9AGAM|nr:hypothetical protein NEOLEDRAFT_1132928 [Neolentinus lepideus HHB14362 ss-1]